MNYTRTFFALTYLFSLSPIQAGNHRAPTWMKPTYDDQSNIPDPINAQDGAGADDELLLVALWNAHKPAAQAQPVQPDVYTPQAQQDEQQPEQTSAPEESPMQPEVTPTHAALEELNAASRNAAEEHQSRSMVVAETVFGVGLGACAVILSIKDGITSALPFALGSLVLLYHARSPSSSSSTELVILEDTNESEQDETYVYQAHDNFRKKRTV